MKKLKLDSLKAMVPLLLSLAFLGTMFLIGSGLFYREPEAQYLFDVPREELEDTYVTIDLDYIYGCYAYTEAYEDGMPTGRITQREYLIDANWEDYMCVAFRGDLIEKAELLSAQSDELYYGTRDTITAGFTVSGYVKALPSDSQRMLKEAVGYSDITPEEQDLYLMLYIDAADTTVDMAFVCIGLAFFAVILVLLMLVLLGYYQRPAKIWLNVRFVADRESESRFLDYLTSLPSARGLRVGAGYILVRHGFTHHILEGNDLLWAYQQSTTHRYLGIIPVGKTNALVLKLRNRKSMSIPMPDGRAKEQLQIIFQQFPNTAVGYSPELQTLYAGNPQGLAAYAAAQRTPQV